MISILDIAVARGAQEIGGSINGAEFERLGLPLFAGCQNCGASLAAYNAYPTRSGYIGCRDCTDDELGFATQETYDTWGAPA